MAEASGTIDIRFLRDVRHGGDPDQLARVGADLASFVLASTTSIDLAIYDFRLTDPDTTALVVAALVNAADRGVTVRIAYDAGKPAPGTAADFARLQADPAPPGTAAWISEHFAGTRVMTKGITAGGQLMHCKYVIRDAPAAAALQHGAPAAGATVPGAISSLAPSRGPAVWTGSTNFTDDAWTRQENNIIVVRDEQVSGAFRIDFDQMWATGSIKGTGKNDAGATTVAGGVLGWDFCPGDGKNVNAALAARITAATTRLILASMVVTSHEVLAALAAAVDRGLPLTGIYDGGQMDPIVAQWKANPHDVGVLANWQKVAAHLARKDSTPYTPTSVHDFMHLKVLISDDEVTTGSYNFSSNAQRNAENQIHLTDRVTVAAYVDYVDAVMGAYA